MSHHIVGEDGALAFNARLADNAFPEKLDANALGGEIEK